MIPLGLALNQLVDTPAGRGRVRGFVRVQRVVRKVLVVVPGSVVMQAGHRLHVVKGDPLAFDLADVVPV